MSHPQDLHLHLWVVSLTLTGLLYSLLIFRNWNIATNCTYDVQHSNNSLYTKSEVSNFFKNAKMCSKWLHNLQKLQSLPESLAKGSNHQLYTQCMPEYTTDSWTLTYSQNTSANYSTHCSPVVPYGIMLHAHHWLREWLASYLSPCNWSITWTNGDMLSIGPFEISFS